MERRVWVRTKGSELYPNIYVILVGPPGVGKSAILSQAERMLRALQDHHIAPNSVSSASLVDSLVLANRKIIRPNDTPAYVQFHYLTVIASELGVFLPIYDPLFMNSLTKFYDGEHYEERRRTGKVNLSKLEHPHLGIIGGTTPSYLNSFLPEGAWDQGFTSRSLFVYAGEPVFRDIFEEDGNLDELTKVYTNLIHDLKSIGHENLYGKMEWSKDAAAAITAWNRKGLPPVPEHGKLVHYNSRRLAHVIKLCMVASISRSNDLLIEVEDYQTAIDWILEIEDKMPDIFHSMGVAGDSKAMEDTWYFVYQIYMKEKKPVLEHRIINFLKDRVPSHSLVKVLDIMVRSGLLKVDLSVNPVGYVPRQKQ